MRGLLVVLLGVGALALFWRLSAWRNAVEARRSHNISPGDYVGPSSCAECHAQEYDRWSHHPHSRMNSNPAPQTVKADFANRRAKEPGGEALFETEGGAYYMSALRDGKRVRRFRVTRVVGSRFMQFFIGKQVEGPEPREHALYRVEQKLPYGYDFGTQRWMPQSYFDPGPPEYNALGKANFDPYAASDPYPWSGSCMPCHNTLPYLLRLAAPGRFGFPDADLHVDLARWLDAFSTEMSSARAAVTTHPLSLPDTLRLGPDNLVTMGISCEACHFGARDHVKDNERLPVFGPQSDVLQVSPADRRTSAELSRKNPYAVNHICAQCHCAPIANYPCGGGSSNSGEALDFLMGACASQLKCTMCHDPHQARGAEGHDDQREVAVCVTCHAKYAAPEAAARHAGHPASAKVTCLDCHMPRITQGLMQAVRTHQIGSPTDSRMYATGQPNACNLCHLDKSVSWTAHAIFEKWGKRVGLEPSWAPAYGGNLERPVGEVWLESRSLAPRLVAVQAYARSPLARRSLPLLWNLLEDPVPCVRLYSLTALDRLLGTKLEADYDVTGTPEQLKKEVTALRAKYP